MRTKSGLSTAARKGVFFLHLWLGLLLGLYAVLIGLTGSLLVFMEEIDTALNPRLHHVEPRGERISLDRAYSAVRSRFPTHPLQRVTLPAEPTAPYELQIGSLKRGAWSSEARHTFQQVFVHPYTGEILGARPRYGAFFSVVFYLHMDLLLGQGGYLLNGYGALLWAVLLLSGLWLWWPSLRSSGSRWQNRLKIQRGASYRRLIHDLHNVSGIYPLLILLLSVLTGAVFIFWEPVEGLVYRVTRSPADPAPVKVKPSPGLLSLDQAVVIGEKVVPQAAVSRLFPAAKPGRPFLILKEFPEGRSLPRAHVHVYLHPSTGEVLRVADSRRSSPGRQAMTWIAPLHFGAWGAPLGAWGDIAVRLLYVLAGLAPCALFVTGVLKYVEKRKAKQKNRRRHQQLARPSAGAFDASKEPHDDTPKEAGVHAH